MGKEHTHTHTHTKYVITFNTTEDESQRETTFPADDNQAFLNKANRK